MLFETTAIIRQLLSNYWGCSWVIRGSLKKSNHAHKMAFVPANLQIIFSCPRDWESDTACTRLFFLREITLGSPYRKQFLKISIPSKGFFYTGNNTGQCKKTDFNESCKCISVKFLSCVAPVLFENIYSMWAIRVRALPPILSLLCNMAVLGNTEIILGD